jgi:alkyldihydroxyacetonephosphate synthase
VDALASLVARLPEGAVSTHPGELSSRSRDAWPLAMLREARGERLPRPMAVVFPMSTDDVSATLAWASEKGVPVVPRGGGSGVRGGAQAVWRGIVLDLSQMSEILEVDEESLAVRVQAGLRVDRLEAALAARGLTVAHHPQSAGLSTVGGWIAAATVGQVSSGMGAIEDLLVGAVAVLPGGEILRLRGVPRSAAGPDLRRLLIGSEGVLGVVTEATLVVARAAPDLRWLALAPPSFEAGLALARTLTQDGLRPLVLRVHDETDATVTFGDLRPEKGPMLVAAFEPRPGRDAVVDAARQAGVVAGAAEEDPEHGRRWWEHRNDPVALYRRIMGEDRTLGPGVVVDTVEVAALWRDLPAVYRAIRDALARHAARPVACHLSHACRSGGSLFFTFLLHGQDDLAVETIYATSWRDAATACHRAGGTISHQDGVGLLKTPFLEEELGAEGVAVLRSLKRALDPAGILNPGKLLPEEN